MRDGVAEFGPGGHYDNYLVFEDKPRMSFSFGGHPERVLTKGARYRVYYLSHSRKELSIEPASEVQGQAK